MPISSSDIQHAKPSYSGQLYDDEGRRKYLDKREFLSFVEAAKLLPESARAFCELVGYAGCRISEALNVCGHHVLEGAVVFRTLKRRRQVFRTVPLPEWLTAKLMRLVPSDDPDARLWRVSRNTAYNWIVRAMRYAQIIGKHACPKGLRHGFGARNVLAGTPLNLIQKWMGHSSIRTTLIYLQLMGPEERQFAAKTW